MPIIRLTSLRYRSLLGMEGCMIGAEDSIVQNVFSTDAHTHTHIYVHIGESPWKASFCISDL